MLKLYCQKCGALNAYISQKPNFCQKCGHSFNEKQVAASTPEQQVVAAQDSEPQIEQLNFNLDKLDVDIQSGPNRSQTISALTEGVKEAGIQPALGGDSFIPEGQQKYTMEDFMREAGNTRRGGNEPEET